MGGDDLAALQYAAVDRRDHLHKDRDRRIVDPLEDATRAADQGLEVAVEVGRYPAAGAIEAIRHQGRDHLIRREGAT